MRDRKDRWWWLATVAMLLAALVVVLVAPGGDVRTRDLLSPVPEGETAAAAGIAGLGVRAKLLRHDRNGGGRVVSGKVEDRVAAVHGAPVVVNQWASWCGPCAAEFGFFERLATRYAGQIAFLGLNARDQREGADQFLATYPVGFPSIEDPDAKQARAIGAGRSWPTTVFYDRTGRRTFVKQGGYATEAKLDADIRRYALGQTR